MERRRTAHTHSVEKCWVTTWRDSFNEIPHDLRLNLKPFLRHSWSQMATEAKALPRFDHLTYRGNSKHSRYGWLRLTPAFSVHLIQENVRSLPKGARVLDPFSGTGTTALVCSEECVLAETTDINPFLLWLGRAKCASYSSNDLLEARRASQDVLNAIRSTNGVKPWVPPLFQIEKWWGPPILEIVGKA